MVVAVRADASAIIGSGHVMRCLTLADALGQRGETVHFITRNLTPPTRAKILASGHALHQLPNSDGQNDQEMPNAAWLSASWQDDAEATLQLARALGASWLVVDHYGINAAWEQVLRNAGIKLAVIDDLADRPHDCDLLLDQTLRQDAWSDYRNLLPAHAQKLFGLRYALLRPEFAPAALHLESLHGLALCVAFSGADPHHLTLRTLQVLHQGVHGIATAKIIASSQNGDLAAIRALCEKANWELAIDTTDVARIMQSCHIGIGAGGGMLWERAACGLPSIAIIVAENQRDQVINAEAAGLVVGLDATLADHEAIRASLLSLARDDVSRSTMAAKCIAVLDGKGTERLVERVLPHGISFRRATPDDSHNIWSWRNDARVRRYSGTAAEISFEQHQSWFTSVLQDSQRHLMIASDGQSPLGVIRFDCAGESATISIYLVPDRLGQGRGASLLLSGEDWLRQNLPFAHSVLAFVQDDNRASVELFRSCGYVRTDGLYRKSVRISP